MYRNKLTKISCGDLWTECIVEDNHGGHGGRGDEEEEEDRPLGREETLSKDSAIDNRYDSDEVSPIGNLQYTAKNQYQKLETNIPRKGIARPQSQFPHVCVCVPFIYSHHAAGNMWTDPAYLNK
jgi:hypothetical protein